MDLHSKLAKNTEHKRPCPLSQPKRSFTGWWHRRTLNWRWKSKTHNHLPQSSSPICQNLHLLCSWKSLHQDECMFFYICHLHGMIYRCYLYKISLHRSCKAHRYFQWFHSMDSEQQFHSYQLKLVYTLCFNQAQFLEYFQYFTNCKLWIHSWSIPCRNHILMWWLYHHCTFPIHSFGNFLWIISLCWILYHPTWIMNFCSRNSRVNSLTVNPWSLREQLNRVLR